MLSEPEVIGNLSVRWHLLADVAKGLLVWKAIARQMGPLPHLFLAAYRNADESVSQMNLWFPLSQAVEIVIVAVMAF